MESSDNNLVPKPNQGLVRLGKSSLMSRGRELATRQTEIVQVKGYRCAAWGWINEEPSGLYIQIAAGDSHFLGLREDGTIVCWGDNDDGQCDAPDGVFTQVAAGERHSLGLREDGTIACWGRNDYGQCDAPSGVFTQVAGGFYHSLGLREDGTIVCWGWNSAGQCDAPDGVFTQLSGGGFHSLGLRKDGTIACWGWNSNSQCDAPDGVFTQVAAGYHHSLGLREDGTITCWGLNDEGQCAVLNVPQTDSNGQLIPTPNARYLKDYPMKRFRQIAAGYNHSAGVLEDGSSICWGCGVDIRDIQPPDRVFMQVACGNFFSVGLIVD